MPYKIIASRPLDEDTIEPRSSSYLTAFQNPNTSINLEQNPKRTHKEIEHLTQKIIREFVNKRNEDPNYYVQENVVIAACLAAAIGIFKETGVPMECLILANSLNIFYKSLCNTFDKALDPYIGASVYNRFLIYIGISSTKAWLDTITELGHPKLAYGISTLVFPLIFKQIYAPKTIEDTDQWNLFRTKPFIATRTLNQTYPKLTFGTKTLLASMASYAIYYGTKDHINMPLDKVVPLLIMCSITPLLLATELLVANSLYPKSEKSLNPKLKPFDLSPLTSMPIKGLAEQATPEVVILGLTALSIGIHAAVESDPDTLKYTWLVYIASLSIASIFAKLIGPAISNCSPKHFLYLMIIHALNNIESMHENSFYYSEI